MILYLKSGQTVDLGNVVTITDSLNNELKEWKNAKECDLVYCIDEPWASVEDCLLVFINDNNKRFEVIKSNVVALLEDNE